MFLHRAQVRRADQRIAVFFRELGWDLNFQANRLHHTGGRAVVNSFDNADAFGWEVALLAKSQDIDPGASPYGREENFEGTGGGGSRRLISCNSEGTKMGVHTGTAREVDDHFHLLYLHKKRIVSLNMTL
jgi:hypothetical protein